MAIYTDKETDGNLTKEIEIIVTRNYYKTCSIKVIVPIDLDEDLYKFEFTKFCKNNKQ